MVTHRVGFFLNDRYLATCYHLYKTDSLWIPYRVRIRYAPKIMTIYVLWDTISASIDYVTLPGQYDFKKHIYDPLNPLTDFLILKTIRPSKSPKVEYDKDWLISQNELQYPMPVFSHKREELILTPKVGVVTPIFISKYIYGNAKDSFYIINFVGTASHGASGAACFNKAGKVVGMIFGGDDSKSQSDNRIYEVYYKNGVITEKDKERYKYYINKSTDSRLGSAVQIDYLLDKYCKGYL